MALGDKKRKEPPQGSGPPHGARTTKRVKVQEARKIQSQPADAALKNGELDLQAFLLAREYEIAALEQGIQNSKSVHARRAFQLVPRALRRRTASHNVKKLPKRLRARARREQIEDNTPVVDPRRRRPRTTRARIRVETAKRLGIVAEKKRKKTLKLKAEAAAKAKEDGGVEGKAAPVVETNDAFTQLILTRPARPKIRRNTPNEPLKPKARFRKRQIDKTWLPTHIWHAKRARMTPPKEPLWRFALPLTPNEKCYRATHRAGGTKGVVIWDASYMSTIGLYGHAKGIERTLQALGMIHPSLWDERGLGWRQGRRSWSGTLSKQRGDSRREIGPATVLWTSQPRVLSPEETNTPSSAKTESQAFIRAHPACFLELFNVLRALIKRETPRLYIEDLRYEIGSIELIGPAAVESLVSILSLHDPADAATNESAKLFQSLSAPQSSDALPRDTVLTFSASDPRLHYPPRRKQTTITIIEDNRVTRTEAAIAASPSLFDRQARYRASCLPSQKALDRRRSATDLGKDLAITAADHPIPLILYQSQQFGSSSPHGSWTVLIPWKCVQPLWSSLVRYPVSTGGNPQIGGLNELRQLAFEYGIPWFPGDYPSTDAGAEWEMTQRATRKTEWDRRPKSKRVAWESLDLGAGRRGEIGVGWACEFERLCKSDAGQAVQSGSQSRDFEPALTEEPAVDQQGLANIQHVTKSGWKSIMMAAHGSTMSLSNALITVKITYLGRGVPNTCARVYRLPSAQSTNTVTAGHELLQDLRCQWLLKLDVGTEARAEKGTAKPRAARPTNSKHLPTVDHNDLEARKRHLAENLTRVPDTPSLGSGRGGTTLTALQTPADAAEHPLVPDEADLIGYVTTGGFNLREARGVAIGSLRVEKALQAVREGQQGRPGREPWLCIVRNAGEAVGWLATWEVV